MVRSPALPGRNPLRDANHALDRAVLTAYGFDHEGKSGKSGESGGDILAQLLELNLRVANRITENEEVTSPGVPDVYPDPANLITDDCIHAE